MFHCQQCGTVSQPRESMNKVVVEQRRKQYMSKDLKSQGEGYETVKELSVCAPCKEILAPKKAL